MLKEKTLDDYQLIEDMVGTCPACGVTGFVMKGEYDWMEFECGASLKWRENEYNKSGWYWASPCPNGHLAATKLRAELDYLLEIAEQSLTGVDIGKREVFAFTPLLILNQALWYEWGRGRNTE